MKGWQITSKDEIVLNELPSVPAETGDVKVRVSKVALSSTDIAAFEGKKTVYPLIPARSAVGLISEADELSGFKKGERVVLNPYKKSPSDKEKICGVSDVKVMGVDCDGFLRDFITLPQESLCTLPEGIKDSDAVFIEQISMAVKVIDELDAEKGSYIAVLGGHTLGNLIAQIALYYQLVPIVIDNDNKLLELAQKHGIYYTVNPSVCDVKMRVCEITGGKMVESTVYEARADMSPNYLIPLTQEKGKIAVVGYNNFLDKLQVNLGDALKKQQTIICIGDGSGEIYSAINLLATAVVSTDGFIDKTVPFSAVPEIFAELRDNKYVYNKIVVDCLAN